jgi:hypothetical protein
MMLDDEGAVLAARTFGGSGSANVVQVAQGPDGTVAVAGWINETADIAGEVLTPVGSTDVFVVQLEP